MKVVVVHLLAQSFGHCPVALIGVHHSGEDILLTTYDLRSSFVGIGIKLFRKFIAAVVVEISGVHIKYQLAVFDGIRFQTSGGNHSVLFQKYRTQLDIYAEALEQLTGKMVKEKIIYSFKLKKEIKL